MTITIEKKHVYVFLGIVLIVIIAIFLPKSCNKPDYETTAKDMKLNAMVTTSIAGQLLADYQKNWSSAISDHKAYNSEGKREWCDDFSQAIAWRYIYYTNHGYIKVLDSIANVVKEDMKIMEDAPSKYEDTQKSFLALYNDMNTLISLVKDPKGSLMTFGQRINELLIDVDKQLNETDLKISVSEAEKNEKTIAIQKIFNELAENSPEKIAERKFKEQFESNKKAGEDFLKENSQKEGVVVLPSGLQYKVLKEGNGTIPTETSRVKVHYEGRTLDGKVFDSSYKRGQATDFRANQVIKGWEEALTHMPEGSIWEVYIPQELAYGERQQGSDIMPYSLLIFKIELIKVHN